MIGALAPGAAYPANEKVPENSVLFVPDLHLARGANATAHAATARADLLRLDTGIVQLGDLTEDGIASQDSLLTSFLSGLPAPWIRLLAGNHDLEQGRGDAGVTDETPRTGAQVMAVHGYNTQNWVKDCGAFQVIGISPDTWGFDNGHNSAQIDLTNDTLDWLDAQLLAATKDCWIACHAPLAGTIGGSAEWCAQPYATINSLLDQYEQAVAWFSGHTHTAWDHASLAVVQSTGSQNICNVNCSAIAYVNPGDDLTDPVRSMRATYRDGGVDLTPRDHTRRYYHPWPDGNYVKTLTT